MKKLTLLFILTVFISAIFAEITLTIPFETDIVGQSYEEVGDFEYESDWMTLTNTSSEEVTFNFHYFSDNAPSGWFFNICNNAGSCYPPFEIPITLAGGETLEIHLVISVHDGAGMIPITIRITEPGAEGVDYNFTFRTADYVNSNDNNVNLVTIESLSNYPNPFNPVTNFNFSINKEDNIKISVFDIKGRKVATVVENHFDAGSHSIVWNAENLTSGIYYYKLETSTSSKIRKLTLLK